MATESDWYDFASKIDAPIVEYVAVAPRGMSNPPRNPKVRAALLKDLQEYGLATEPREASRCSTWPPRPLRGSNPYGLTGSLELRNRMALSYSPSAPSVLNAVTCTPDPRSPSRKKKPGESAPGPQQRRAVSLAAAERKERTDRIFSAFLEKNTPEMEIFLEKPEDDDDIKVGIVNCGGILLAKPEVGTLLHKWNAENPESPVTSGDRVVEVNEIRDDLDAMLNELKEAEEWDLRLQKAWDESADRMQLHNGGSTATWRAKRICIDEPADLGKLYLKDAKGRPFSRGPEEKPKEEPQNFHLRSKLRIEPFMTDHEVSQARETLRGQSRLLVSAIDDRFCISADMTRGFHAPMCTKGAGVATGIPAAAWTADGSYLQKFHNGAIRHEHPNSLQPLKQVIELSTSTGHAATQQKRKKKAKASKEQDDLELNDLGSIEPKYPVDESLKAMRRLKKKHFPEDMKAREEELRRIRYEKQLKEQAKKEEMASFASGGMHFSQKLQDTDVKPRDSVN